MLTIRHYRPDTVSDGDAIAAIYAHHVLHGRASFETEAPDSAEMRGRMQTIMDAGYPVLIAELDGRVAGYAYAGPFHHRAAYRGTVEDSIYVDHAMARRGIGRALLSGLVDQARKAGFQQMMAVIGDSDNAGSIELHRALGFREIGVARGIGFKFGSFVDVVYMQLALQDSAAGQTG
ncbi:MAG: GNAT family N-acetyltransferase [Candidatus Puniceispirillaceae bacterium]